MPSQQPELERLLKTLRDAAARGVLPDAVADHPGRFTAASADRPLAFQALVEQFTRELTALSGEAHLVGSVAEASSFILGLLRARSAQRVLTWGAPSPPRPGERDAAVRRVNAELWQAGIELVVPDVPDDREARARTYQDIEAIQVGVTGARAALADTGSVVVTSGWGRPRLASLLPPVHVVVLEPADFYPSLPAFLGANPGVVREASNLVVITGPSRTADIEMTLSWGVHGPKHVHAIIVTGNA